MQALWLENHVLTYRAAVPDPQLRPGEALIKIRLAGICGTDLELLRGYYPYSGIPGHEFVGEVVASPDPEWVGERVVGEINVPCGECSECKAGRLNHCVNRIALGIRDYPGAFADFLTLPLVNLHQIPAVVPDEAAIFIEPLAAALEIQQQVMVCPNMRVLLIGSGRLGILIAQTLANTGCDLLVTARHDRVRKILAANQIQAIYPEEAPLHQMDIVVDASGSPQGFSLALKTVHPGGTIILKSTYAGVVDANLSTLVVDEITLIGSRCGPFGPAIRLLASDKVDPRPMIDAHFPLCDGLTAFENASKPGALKVLLHP